MELEKNGRKVTPRFAITFAILICFSVLCSFTTVKIPNGLIVIDWLASKPLLAFAGIVTATFGAISSMGFLYTCGVSHQDMVFVMPFLAVSIGIDNMFLMLNCWRGTNRAESPSKRLEDTLSHSAVSITITSLTDALSFAIGTLVPMPAVRIFCAFSSLAITFTFLYQMTFFLAVMVYQGRKESDTTHCIFCFPTVPAEETCYVGVVGYMTWWGVNLDCISMITIIMSLGFSVDFAAHISYGYVANIQTEDKCSPEQGAKAVLGTLAWPLIQGALSTVIGVVALSTVNAYITQTFFKTVFLVITFGTLHALVFLPVALVAVHKVYNQTVKIFSKSRTCPASTDLAENIPGNSARRNN